MGNFQEFAHKVKELSFWVIRNANTVHTCVVEGNLNSLKITVCKAEITVILH